MTHTLNYENLMKTNYIYNETICAKCDIIESQIISLLR